MSKFETCEGCQQKKLGCDFALLCSVCQDNATRFDITLADKKVLETVIRDALAELKKIGKIKDMSIALQVSRAIGRLKAGEERCRNDSFTLKGKGK